MKSLFPRKGKRFLVFGSTDPNYNLPQHLTVAQAKTLKENWWFRSLQLFKQKEIDLFSIHHIRLLSHGLTVAPADMIEV